MVKGGAHIQFGVLGDLSVTIAGHAVEIGSRKQRVLLAVLLCNRRRTVSAPILIDALWGERPPPSALPTLRTLANRLRQALAAGGEPPLLGRDGGYLLDVDAHQIDAERFAGLVEAARVARGVDLAQAADHLQSALALWRGPAFGDLAEAEAIRLEADRLEKARLGGIEELAEMHLGLGRAEVAVDVLTPHVAGYPLRERAAGALMLALYRVGRQADALTVYQKLRRLLDAELGVDPTPAVRQLHGRILRHDGDLGGAPAQPPRDGTPARREPGTLPLATSPFVGREDLLTGVAAALRRSRLVTLTGPGGVGKSRLALETAHRLAEPEHDGIRLCELAPVPDSAGVGSALAAALGIRQLRGATLEDSLLEALAHSRILVIVDNCEHVLDGVVPILERVLGACPDVHVLATSRERLGAEGESVVEVLPLAVPDDDVDLDRVWDHPAPALELLRDRAEAIRPGTCSDPKSAAALVEIARRLDGLPLALELAAARVATMGPAEVSRRLDHRFTLLTTGRRGAPTRHRTLRATLEWSYDLLGAAERHVFEQACVFVGGFTLAAAEQVCAPDGDGDAAEVVDLIGSLVDKSMLVLDDSGPTTRYRMLETLREFGHERLAERRGVLDEAHARYFATLASQLEPQLRGAAEADAVATLVPEIGNLRAGHTWALRAGRRGVAAEISASLVWFGFLRLRIDLLGWAEDLVDDDPEVTGSHLPGALYAAGLAAWMRGDLERARAIGERAIAVAADQRAGRGGLYVVGVTNMHAGRLDDAAAAFERSAALADQAGDHYHAARALGALSLAQTYAGNVTAATRTAGDCRVAAARSGAPSALSWAAYALAEVVLASDPDGALTHLDRAIKLAAIVSAHFNEGVALVSATSLHVRHSDPATAAAALAHVLDHWERAGNWRHQWVTLRHAAHFFARVDDAEAAATLLGALESTEAANIFGADAERLVELRKDLVARLGAAANQCLADGASLTPGDLIRYTSSALTAHRGDSAPAVVGRKAELAAIQALLAGSRTALPAALTPFVGRAEEVTAVATALGRSRLVTLIGPGGAGKTRLAIHAAQTVHEAYPDGAWFADLTSLRDPDLVPAQIAAAVGLDVAALLAGGKTLLDSLCDQLRNRQALLVLDNCEHLVDAAAKVAGDLLARASRVGILATSRERLAVPGEVVVRVGGLSLPPADPAGAAELRGSDAVVLFCARAAASGADFALTDANAAAVANICRRLDGLPLAVELAAARTRMLGVQRLADRVATMAHAAEHHRAVDPRHRTLATAIEWSHDLLTPDERIVLRRLSVFPAPWTLDAAEAVAAGGDALSGPEGEDVFDLLARLVDKSLVLAMPDDGDEPRYRMLETIRQYTAARLAEHDETDLVRARHREFWRELGRQWVTRDTSATWIRRVDRDLDNIREVLAWSAERGDEQAICEIVAPLSWHWTTSSPPDAVPWFRRAVAAPAAGIETAAAHARLGLGQLLQTTSNSSAAERLAQFRDALEFATAAHVPTALAWARAGLTELLLLDGRPDEPDPEGESDSDGAPPVCHASATFLASVRALPHLASGDLDRAQQILGDLATRADRHHPDEYVRVHVLALLAVAEAARGEAAAAEANAQAAVLGARQFPSPLVTAMALIRAVEAALLSGRVPRARALLPEALLLLRDLGTAAWVGEALESTAVALAMPDPATAAACLGAAAEMRAQRGEHGCLTPALRDLVARTEAEVLATLGPDPERAARRHGSGLERAEMLVRAREAVLHLEP